MGATRPNPRPENGSMAWGCEPIDSNCRCEVCGRFSRGYIRHLFQAEEDIFFFPDFYLLCDRHHAL